MIAFNGQYLPAASHGNMRITAACLGGQWVMGGWLKTATQQAIIAAFGAEEGIAVIIRTNDYLNALALTDTTRAQQLAMFINEDPLLVTSLVETSKERWLVGDGASYFNTGVTLRQANGSTIKMKLQWQSFATNGYQVNGWGNNPQIGISVTGGKAYWQNFATGNQPLEVNKTYDVVLDLTQEKSVLHCDGFNDLVAGSVTTPNDYDFLVFCMTRNGIDRINYANEKVGAVEVGSKHFLPYRDPSTGEMELLDILTGTLATRVGTFTEIIENKYETHRTDTTRSGSR